MKCRKCNKRAVINMRQHKLALCSFHFLDWVVNQTQRTIERYKMFTPDQKILVAVSGGKDSLALWDVLQKLGYQTGGLYIHLGIEGEGHYSQESQRLTEKFAKEKDLPLHIYNVKQETGSPIEEIAFFNKRGKGKPCAVCGLVKRHTINEVANQFDYDVLVTGHNLDDEVAVLFGNTLSWEIDYLRRQSPVLKAKKGLLPKAKPFCRFYERETAAYSLLAGIEYIEEECPFSDGSTSIQQKEILNILEHQRPGAKLAFYVKFLKVKKDLFQNLDEDGDTNDVLYICPTCGQSTQSEGNCSYCNTIKRTQLLKNK